MSLQALSFYCRVIPFLKVPPVIIPLYSTLHLIPPVVRRMLPGEGANKGENAEYSDRISGVRVLWHFLRHSQLRQSGCSYRIGIWGSTHQIAAKIRTAARQQLGLSIGSQAAATEYAIWGSAYQTAAKIRTAARQQLGLSIGSQATATIRTGSQAAARSQHNTDRSQAAASLNIGSQTAATMLIDSHAAARAQHRQLGSSHNTDGQSGSS
jgi:hypothetical protein